MNFELQNIEDYTKDLVWMLKATIQVEKEFCVENWVLIKPINAQTAFEDIVVQVHKKLANLIKLKGDSFVKHLLYTIDISQAQVAKALVLEVDIEFSRLLAKLIVRRCLQKVLIRNYYKSPEKFALGNSLEE